MCVCVCVVCGCGGEGRRGSVCVCVESVCVEGGGGVCVACPCMVVCACDRVCLVGLTAVGSLPYRLEDDDEQGQEVEEEGCDHDGLSPEAVA